MKYKLIKEYPGSSKEGTIIDCDKFLHNNQVISVLDFPEFWEKIVEKTYEVLSIQGNTTYTIFSKVENNHFRSDAGCNIISFEQGTSGCRIHSVKRLSDGEIFTVGDSVKLHSDNTIYIINTLTISNDKTYIYCHGMVDVNDSRLSSFGQPLTNLVKISTPLCVTEDGVKLFDEGDRIYEVTPQFANILNRSVSVGPQYSNTKFFSTKEKAEEYILMNKPCLSVENIKEMLKSVTFKNITDRGELLHKLFEFVIKSKNDTK